MKGFLLALAGVALVCMLGTGAIAYFYFLRPSAASVPQEKVAALKELRDTGVITAQEYDSRVQALQAAPPATAPAPPSGSSAIASLTKAAFSGTRKVEIADPVYQMTAFTMEVPGDWKFAGDVVRAPGCHSNGAAMRFTAQSPDGLTAYVALPGVTWSWSNNESLKKMMEQNHCADIEIDTAAAFLVNIAIPNIRPNAKVIEMLPLLPEGQAAIKDQLAKRQEQNAAMAKQFGQQPQKLTIDGARAHIQYERDGHPVEEMIAAVLDCTESTVPAVFKTPAYQRHTCTSRGTSIMRAPQGHLNEMMASAQLRTMSKSLQNNPQWFSRLMADQQAAFQKFQDANNRQFQANLKANQQQFEAMQGRARQFDANLRASTDRALAADRQRQAAIDASAHATALYSLDRQEFRNPNTGQVIEASNQYNHQWISSDGSTLIQTNDHTLDPNGVVYPVSQSWTELVAK